MGRLSAAHPRVCGENGPMRFCRERGWGSSPRVRGKLLPVVWGGVARRLIPACAGKTSAVSTTNAGRTAHPRVCGENVVTMSECPMIAGSSPRVRGKPSVSPPSRKRQGLIPACAGKTLFSTGKTDQPPAHPRMCGENRPGISCSVKRGGSSPRVRGKRGMQKQTAMSNGLIPACAGKTC